MPLMTGSPPAPADQVHLGNWRKPPFCRWAFNHVREIVPAAPVPASPLVSRPIGGEPAGLSGFEFTDHTGRRCRANDWAERAAVDAVVVQRGETCEVAWYAQGQSAAVPHILMSVSKSVLGLLAGAVLEQSSTSAEIKVTDVLPELRHSAWRDATLQQVLDMQVSIDFEEDYLATEGAIISYRKAQGWNPLEPGEEATDLRGFFPTLSSKGGAHGEHFHYVSPNTDMAAWALERIASARYSDLLSTLLWQPMGAEHDAYITVDRLGAPRAAGGFCATAPDLTRLGLLVAQHGAVGSQQVLPESWVVNTMGGGSGDAFKSGNFHDKFGDADISYRNYCYWNAAPRPFVFGVGIHGQAWLVDPAEKLAMTVFSSHGDPQPVGAMDNAISLFKAVRESFD